MALIHCDFFAETLGMCMSMCVILPQRARGQIGMAGGNDDGADRRGWPTLYLLHGLSDDHTIWQRRTSIERYVAPMHLAVVMPNVHRSWYTDMARGHRYWTYLSEELPRLARQFFRLSNEREDNFVAGLSMGGYGAFKLAMRQPDRFAAAASLSGALDRATGFTGGRMEDEAWAAEQANVFGDVSRFADSDEDTMALARRLAASDGPKPKLYQCCGTADFLYDQNVAFRDQAEAIGLDLHYVEDDGRGHDWAYWDERIQDVLDWLPIRKEDRDGV